MRLKPGRYLLDSETDEATLIEVFSVGGKLWYRHADKAASRPYHGEEFKRANGRVDEEKNDETP